MRWWQFTVRWIIYFAPTLGRLTEQNNEQTAYFLEAERLSDDFAERVKVVVDYMKADPSLADDEAY